jgi:hypothetical protein
MAAPPSRPNRIHVGILAALTLAGAATLRGPLAVGGKFVDLAIGVLVTFGCVVAYGQFRIGVSRARRTRGFREWSGPLTSHRLMQVLLLAAIVVGAWHIYEACLKIFTKVFE